MRGASTGGVAAPAAHSSAHGQDHFFTVNFAELKTGELRYQMIGIVGSVHHTSRAGHGGTSTWGTLATHMGVLMGYSGYSHGRGITQPSRAATSRLSPRR